MRRREKTEGASGWDPRLRSQSLTIREAPTQRKRLVFLTRYLAGYNTLRANAVISFLPNSSRSVTVRRRPSPPPGTLPVTDPRLLHTFEV